MLSEKRVEGYGHAVVEISKRFTSREAIPPFVRCSTARGLEDLDDGILGDAFPVGHLDLEKIVHHVEGELGGQRYRLSRLLGSIGGGRDQPGGCRLFVVCDSVRRQLSLFAAERREVRVDLGETVDGPLWLAVPYEDDVHREKASEAGE